MINEYNYSWHVLTKSLNKVTINQLSYMTSLNAMQLLILERTANGTNSTILNGLPGKVHC